MKNSELISKLDPGILQKFEEKQIRYVRYLPDKTRDEYMNWQHIFATEDREVKLKVMRPKTKNSMNFQPE